MGRLRFDGMKQELKISRLANRTRRLPFLVIALAAGVACLQPADLDGKDQGGKDRDGNEGGKPQKHSGKAGPPVAQGGMGKLGGSAQSEKLRNRTDGASGAVQRQSGVIHVPGRSVFQKGNCGVGNSSPGIPLHGDVGTRHIQTQRINEPAQFAIPQGNRSNRYGGRWIEASTHSDWDRSREHYWNDRRYRWYDGGWLIVVSGNLGDYSNGDSLASEVQQRLAVRGYYRGEVDGDIGPASRRAIAGYQDDHGLRATGRIDDDLIESLRLK